MLTSQQIANANTGNIQQQLTDLVDTMKNATALILNPQQPRIVKPWHENINNEMRKHLVQKIIQTIFPTHDHNIYRDPRLSNLVNYAIKTECEMYEQAKDQEEYFHLLAERIYKIQKEFEDKQRMSKINNSQNSNGPPENSSSTLDKVSVFSLLNCYFHEKTLCQKIK